jgi:hypothetical protein
MKSATLTTLKQLLPAAGICLFFVLFWYSTTIYPGGSQADLKAEGFAWRHNYWCELMNSDAINGKANPAMPFAVTGIVFLSIGLAAFFYMMPAFCTCRPEETLTARYGAILATGCASLLFTDYHDLMLAGFSIFTLITLLSGLTILYNNHLKKFCLAGIAALLMIQINNLMYYLRLRIDILPLAQKATIILTLVWILIMNLYFVFKSQKKD